MKPFTVYRLSFTAKKRGAVLLLTFIIMVTLIAITGAFLYMTSTQLRGSAYDVQSSKAFWIAEAGIQEVIYKLKTDSGYRNSPTDVSGNLGEASETYSVSVSKSDSTYTLTSTGAVGDINRKITQSVVVSSAALKSAIHADGATLNFDGSNGTVNGNVSCHVQVLNYDDMTITGTITAPMDKLNPNLDFDYYKSLAQEQSQYYTSNLTFENGTYTGVYYTTKKVTIGDNAIINGSILAEGNIDFENSADNVQINPTNDYPALATQGNINSSDTGPPAQRVGLHNSTINGLVYADNNITFDYMKNEPGENTVFNGTILADNNLQMQNGTDFTINYDENIFSPMPGFTFTGGELAIFPQGDWNEVVPAS